MKHKTCISLHLSSFFSLHGTTNRVRHWERSSARFKMVLSSLREERIQARNNITPTNLSENTFVHLWYDTIQMLLCFAFESEDSDNCLSLHFLLSVSIEYSVSLYSYDFGHLILNFKRGCVQVAFNKERSLFFNIAIQEIHIHIWIYTYIYVHVYIYTHPNIK